MSKVRRAFLATTAIALFGIAYLAYTRRPVIFAFSDPSELQRPLFSVLNPFRETEPEDVAEALLARLQRRELSALDVVQVPGGISTDIREKEREYPLRKWKLIDRRDSGDRVTLVYRTARVTTDHLDSPVVIVVEHKAQHWVITSFSPVY